MNEADALELSSAAIWTIIIASGPAVGAAMVVGVAIALLQALTQVQEMTLTFIPKIVVILLVIALTGAVHRRADLLLHQRGLRPHRDGLLSAGRGARRHPRASPG